MSAASDPPEAQGLGQDQATRFGALVREHRKALRMSQDDLALATGVGRRFIIDLESGKSSAQLGRALLVANAVGMRIFDRLEEDAAAHDALPPDLAAGTLADLADDDLGLPP